MIATLLLAVAPLAAPEAPPAPPQTAHPSARGGIPPKLLGSGTILDHWLKDAGFKGNALVARWGKPILRAGYALADREKGTPYTPETVFSIGSITKQFTAAAILKLEMQGKLKVEDSISKYLPGVPADKKAITLDQLLTHTSGLESDFAKDYDPVGRDEYVKMILASKLRTPPGTKHYYANSGYSLLGAIIEIVSGKPYEQYLNENLFAPAGMKETGYTIPKWNVDRIAVGYRNGERWGRITEKPWAPDGPYWALRCNGGIHSTLDDMLRWHVALMGDAVLSKAEKDKMYARHVREEEGGDSFYGYGWSIEDSPWGGTLIAHNGGNGVMYADFLRYVDEDLVVILSTNDSTVRGGQIAHALARLAHGESVPLPAAPNAAAKPLGDSPREPIARAWIDAFTATGFDAMHAFRAEHGVTPPGTEMAEYDRRLTETREHLGTLAPDGVVGTSNDGLDVRARSTTGPTVVLHFKFNSDGRVSGIGVEAGD